jgi:hypothetical protein
MDGRACPDPAQNSPYFSGVLVDTRMTQALVLAAVGVVFASSVPNERPDWKENRLTIGSQRLTASTVTESVKTCCRSG